MALAIFDLDETLIDVDSCSAWTRYLVEQGLADDRKLLVEEARLMADYHRGELDIDAYMALLMQPFIGRSQAELDTLVVPFVTRCILPHVRDRALAQLAWHRERDDRLLVISASGSFLVREIVRRLDIHELLAIDMELCDGLLTGRIAGIPSYRDGKVQRLRHWLAEQGESLTGSHFYSDSHNDLPLLELVDRPVAVSPDPQLARLAAERGWPSLSW